jgi:hypothetical protein
LPAFFRFALSRGTLLLGISIFHLAVSGLLSAFYIPFRERHLARFLLMESEGFAGLRAAGGIDSLDAVCWIMHQLLHVLSIPLGWFMFDSPHMSQALAQSSMVYKVINSLFVAMLCLPICFGWMIWRGETTAVDRDTGSIFSIPQKVFVSLVLGGTKELNLVTRVLCWTFIHYLVTSAAFLNEASQATRGTSTFLARLVLGIFQFPLTPFYVERHYWVLNEGYDLVLFAIANSGICAVLIVVFFKICTMLTVRSPHSITKISGAALLAVFSTALVLGQFFSFRHSPADELYSFGMIHMMGIGNESLVYRHLRRNYALLFPYRKINRSISYQMMYGAKAHFRPKNLKRATIDPDARLTIETCAISQKQFNGMSDQEAETIISQSAIALRMNADSLGDYGSMRMLERIRTPKNETEQAYADYLQQTAHHYGQGSVRELRQRLPMKEATKDLLQKCSLQILKHFGHFAVNAAADVIPILENPALSSVAADTLRALSPLDPEHIATLRELEQDSHLLSTRTLIPYVLEQRSSVTPGGPPPLGLVNKQKGDGLVHSILVLKEVAEDAQRKYFAAAKNVKLPHTIRDDVGWVQEKLNKYNHEDRRVAEVIVMNEACNGALPQRNVDALRELCEQDTDSRCDQAYHDATARFRQYPVIEFNCVTTVNALILERAFKVMDRFPDVANRLGEQRRMRRNGASSRKNKG